MAENNLQIVPAETSSSRSKVEAQYVEMMVPLYSHGCVRKVKNALSHIRGIYSVNVEFNEQKVTVWGICNKYDVLSTIRKKRKDAQFWNPEDNDDDVEPEGGGEEQVLSQSSTTKVSSSFLKRRRSAQPLALLRSRSLISWKLSLKKVFSRTHSF
ncbi:unnamed protein product [Cuscuta epithymum]|uniref:HMA domain-containing protein n=1 Tax=Cuscuta epithymum TaxID=186058 RepID=A0AAV0ELH2_9ASTE|nr:unnamed protein product [Cuscuta epithymum]CAH9123390.1 unnamed protein product [Cuscuta epithymum]CAH9128799.1 unnamed protein product [Cuscuta epithymum]